HPLISQVPVPPLDGAVLSLLDSTAPRAELIRILRWLAQTPALSSARDPSPKTTRDRNQKTTRDPSPKTTRDRNQRTTRDRKPGAAGRPRLRRGWVRRGLVLPRQPVQSGSSGGGGLPAQEWS